MYATQSILRMVAVSLLFLIFLPAAARADKTPAVDFEKSIWPIFQAHCISCHGPDSQQGELRLDGRAAIVQGGISGPAVVPGQLCRQDFLRRHLRKVMSTLFPARGCGKYSCW